MPMKIIQLNTCGIYNTQKVGNASFVIIVVNRMQKVNIVGLAQFERIASSNIGQDFPNHIMSLGDVSV